jgi:hypothetical protein
MVGSRLGRFRGDLRHRVDLPAPKGLTMCDRDIEIGRETRAINYQLSITGTSALILPNNPKRYALYFGNPNTGTVHFGIVTPAAAGKGFSTASTGQPIWLNIQLHGDLVRQAFYAAGSTTLTWNVTEIEWAN